MRRGKAGRQAKAERAAVQEGHQGSQGQPEEECEKRKWWERPRRPKDSRPQRGEGGPAAGSPRQVEHSNLGREGQQDFESLGNIGSRVVQRVTAVLQQGGGGVVFEGVS